MRKWPEDKVAELRSLGFNQINHARLAICFEMRGGRAKHQNGKTSKPETILATSGLASAGQVEKINRGRSLPPFLYCGIPTN
jgi:hypothetical protein